MRELIAAIVLMAATAAIPAHADEPENVNRDLAITCNGLSVIALFYYEETTKVSKLSHSGARKILRIADLGVAPGNKDAIIYMFDNLVNSNNEPETAVENFKWCLKQKHN